MNVRLPARLLFMADLCRRMSDIERGRTPMEPLTYRVLARQIRQSAAGYTDVALIAAFGPSHSQVRHLLENRHFAEYGSLPGDGGRPCEAQARHLFAKLGVRLPVVGDRPR